MRNSTSRLGRTAIAGTFVIVSLLAFHAPSAQAQQGDAAPPQLSLPGSITVEATGRFGVVVSFAATATDTVDPDPSVACNPASGSVFVLGTTMVNCTGTDASGNSSSGSFPVSVRDISPPVLALPASIEAEASSRLGALVIFTALATDTVDPGPLVVCNPASGSVFSLGATTVSCTAADASGNVAGEHFVVTVVDTSPPRITGRSSPTPNANGWNNTDVAVTFECTDAASGIFSCEGDATLTGEGAGKIVRGTATDLAGNTATTSLRGINLDKTAPTVTITTPAEGAEFLISATVPAVWQTEDALSGIDSESGAVDSGASIDTRGLGLKSFRVTAIDLAGNRASTTHFYTVLSPFSVFVMEGARAVVEAGAPRGEFLVEGIFEPGALSNGVDVLNEEVAVTFNGFDQTMPAGFFSRDDGDQGFQFDGPSGGITQIDIRDDGRFQIRAEGLKLPGIVLGTPVPFSLRIGDDVGRATILFEEAGRYRLETRQARDFFGTVMAVGEGILAVKTGSGIVGVVVTQATEVRLPHKQDSAIADLVEGDLVAVSLVEEEGGLAADKIVLIPGKTRNKHVPGEVVALTDTHITVRPPGSAASPIIFSRSPGTEIRFYRGETELMVGSFVVVAAVRDPLTGLLSPQAREINVTAMRPAFGTEGGTGRVPAAAQNRAEIRGVFEGVDETGNWIINGIPVLVGAETEIDEGLAVGQVVEIAAELRPDGTLLAQEVKSTDRGTDVIGKIRLLGVLEGIEEQTENWIVGGLAVAVGPTTDTDGFPSAGQLLKVQALLQEDGSLLAREIENKGEPRDHGRDPGQMKLEATFQGVDGQGNWIVGGARVAVDPSTRLKGTPAVGQPVEVRAMLREDGPLLALTIEGKKRDGLQPRSEAEVRGVFEDILDDGTLVINGVRVALSILTELEGDPQVGDFVEVKALIQEDGLLLAREVERKAKAGAEELPETNEVEIEGAIDRVNEDGTLLVNGITVVISALSEVRGDLLQGASVKLEGLLQTDGSILARELKGEGRRATTTGTEVKVEGSVEMVNRNDAGDIVSVVVNGLPIGLRPLTKTEGVLNIGSGVEIDAVIAEGALLAGRIEAGREARPPDEEFEIEVAGAIEAIQLDDQGRIVGVTVNGLELLVGIPTELKGVLAVGETVEIKGAISGGTLRADEVEGRGQGSERPKRIGFELEGFIESLIYDEKGDVVGLVMDGNSIALEALTRVKGTLEPGAAVDIEGIVSEGQLVASKVELKEKESGTAG